MEQMTAILKERSLVHLLDCWTVMQLAHMKERNLELLKENDSVRLMAIEKVKPLVDSKVV